MKTNYTINDEIHFEFGFRRESIFITYRKKRIEIFSPYTLEVRDVYIEDISKTEFPEEEKIKLLRALIDFVIKDSIENSKITIFQEGFRSDSVNELLEEITHKNNRVIVKRQ